MAGERERDLQVSPLRHLMRARKASAHGRTAAADRGLSLAWPIMAWAGSGRGLSTPANRVGRAGPGPEGGSTTYIPPPPFCLHSVVAVFGDGGPRQLS